MESSNDPYGDPILVPTSTYRTIYHYQVVWGSGRMGFSRDQVPVVLRGALHCRIAKRGSARYYGTAVLTRYIRRLRITETDSRRWYDWVNHVLAPKARHTQWWYSQRSTLRDIQEMVSSYSVVIDGEAHFVPPECRKSVEVIHRALRRLSIDQ